MSDTEADGAPNKRRRESVESIFAEALAAADGDEDRAVRLVMERLRVDAEFQGRYLKITALREEWQAARRSGQAVTEEDLNKAIQAVEDAGLDRAEDDQGEKQSDG